MSFIRVPDRYTLGQQALNDDQLRKLVPSAFATTARRATAEAGNLSMAEAEPRRTTSIEWTHHTWNPFVGCSIKSAGCTNCYAMAQAYRLEHAFNFASYRGTTRKVNGNIVWTGKVNRSSDANMLKPLQIIAPSLIFVNSMSDFWHEAAEDRWRAEALDIMRAAPRHRFQVLTKRPENIAGIMARMGIRALPDNLWLGCTLEDHRVADRAPILARIPARIRFLSIEPITARVGRLDLDGIHWVITGGESGPRARPNKPEWTREVRDQAASAGIALLHKQWGHYASNPLVVEQGMTEAQAKQLDPPHNGKGGALLDGRLWREFPERP
jgi:protein gp37